jgi:hypothetical protein
VSVSRENVRTSFDNHETNLEVNSPPSFKRDREQTEANTTDAETDAKIAAAINEALSVCWCEELETESCFLVYGILKNDPSVGKYFPTVNDFETVRGFAAPLCGSLVAVFTVVNSRQCIAGLCFIFCLRNVRGQTEVIAG